MGVESGRGASKGGSDAPSCVSAPPESLWLSGPGAVRERWPVRQQESRGNTHRYDWLRKQRTLHAAHTPRLHRDLSEDQLFPKGKTWGYGARGIVFAPGTFPGRLSQQRPRYWEELGGRGSCLCPLQARQG